MDKAKELNLLERWAKGDVVAGDKLLRRYMPVLQRFFINKVHENDVSDLIAEAMEGAARSIARFRQESSVKTFLLGIARNKLLKYYERCGRKRDRVDPLGDKVSELLDVSKVSSMLAHRREQEMVIDALRRLPIDLQTLVELAYWEGLSMDECAEVLGIGRGKVVHGLRAARRELREAIEAGGGSASERKSVSEKVSEWVAEIHAGLGEDSQGRLARLQAIEAAMAAEGEEADSG